MVCSKCGKTNIQKLAENVFTWPVSFALDLETGKIVDLDPLCVTCLEQEDKLVPITTEPKG